MHECHGFKKIVERGYQSEDKFSLRGWVGDGVRGKLIGNLEN